MRKTTHTAVLIILCGIAIRLALYLANNPLSYDEAFAPLIITRSWAGLFYPLLNGEVVVALGPLVITKLSVIFLGHSEYSLRLFPFICSILALLLFYDLAKRYLKAAGLIWALLLFSCSYYICGYSAEWRPYSSDVFFTLLALKLLFWIKDGEITVLQFSVLAIAGLIITWFSFSAIPVLFSIGGLLLYRAISSGNRQLSLKLALLLCSWLTGLIAYYHTFISRVNIHPFYLYRYWMDHNAYPQLWPFQLKTLVWPFITVLNFFENPVGLDPLAGLALCTIGSFFFLRQNKKDWFLLFIPVLTAFLLAVFQVYAFMWRMVLYLVPIILLFVAMGLDESIKFTGRRNKILMFLLAAFVFAKPLSLFTANPIMNPDGSRKAVNYIAANMGKGDIVMVGRYAFRQFAYYALDTGITYSVISNSHPWYSSSEIPSWAGQNSGLENYLLDLAKLTRSKKKIWLFVTDNEYHEKECIMSFLFGTGKFEHRFSDKNAHVFTYEAP